MNEGMNQNPNANQYQQPVSFANPMQSAAPKKPMDMNFIILWAIRGVAILAELLFFLPLCVVSCADETKNVGGFQACFGFKFMDEKVKGIWWLIFLFIFLAAIIAVWFVKDMKMFKASKLTNPLALAATSVLALLNIIIMISFKNEAAKRALASAAEIKFTFGFTLLMIIEVLMCLGGAACIVILIIKDPDIINNLGAEFKALFPKKQGVAPAMAAPNQVYQQPQAYQQPQPQAQPQAQPAVKFCTNCGAQMNADQAFCVQCGTKSV